MKEPTIEEAIIYVRKLKKKLSHRHKKYDDFIRIMHDFSSRNISPSSVVSKVQDLFHGETHLILGFNRFIPNDCKKLSCPDSREINTRIPMKIEEVVKKISKNDILNVLNFVNRVHLSLEGEHGAIEKFYDAMMKYGNNKDLECLKEELYPLFKNKPELEIEFSQFCSEGSKEEQEKALTDSGETNEKQNGRTHVHTMKKSDMDECEDAMYEADMLMHWLMSATEATERLLEACEKTPTKTIEVASYLTSMNLRSIERLYGEGEGVLMVKLLHQSPGWVSSIILPRLSQKLEEIVAKRTDIYNIVAAKMSSA